VADEPIHLSPILAELAQMEQTAAFSRMKSCPEGLRAGRRAAGNKSARILPRPANIKVGRGAHSPGRAVLVILLTVLATISFATGDPRAGTVMTLTEILDILLRFVQKSRVDAAAVKLKAMINVTARRMHAGKEEETPQCNLCPAMS
jgi:hypothetical protein